MTTMEKARGWQRSLVGRAQRCQARLRAKLACERGQGTTEYAILVGVSTSRKSLNDEI